MDTAQVEKQARERVAKSAALKAHAELLLDSDWSNMDEHLQWVATAPEADIIAWAEEIEASFK